jgi:hypothetical protein
MKTQINEILQKDVGAGRGYHLESESYNGQ